MKQASLRVLFIRIFCLFAYVNNTDFTAFEVDDKTTHEVNNKTKFVYNCKTLAVRAADAKAYDFGDSVTPKIGVIVEGDKVEVKDNVVTIVKSERLEAKYAAEKQEATTAVDELLSDGVLADDVDQDTIDEAQGLLDIKTAEEELTEAKTSTLKMRNYLKRHAKLIDIDVNDSRYTNNKDTVANEVITAEPSSLMGVKTAFDAALELLK